MSRDRSGPGSGGMFIPAGLFIGLGIGILVNQPGAGVLIGLGAGFIAAALVKGAEREDARTTEEPVTAESPGSQISTGSVVLAIIGVLMVVLGIGLVYYPVSALWPYIGAIALIMIGIWFIFRGTSHFRHGS